MAQRLGFLNFCKQLLFPPKCAACRTLMDWRMPWEEPVAALCAECLKKWDSETLETCGICAKRVTECICMPLPMQKAKCEGFCKLTYYSPRKREPVQNRVIYHIKQSSDRRTEGFLARALLPSVEQMLATSDLAREDLILTYLPRGNRARLRYGTDQARAIAAALSKISGIPMQTLILRRRGADKQQKGLSPAKRMQNAKRSFRAYHRADCKKKTVLLVDDMVTTGEGMAAGIRLLHRMGAARVFAIAVATDECNKDLLL